MTDKEFVLSVYPKGRFGMGSRSYMLFIFNDVEMGDEGKDFTLIKKCKTEEEGWEVVKNLIYQRMLKKLGQ